MCVSEAPCAALSPYALQVVVTPNVYFLMPPQLVPDQVAIADVDDHQDAPPCLATSQFEDFSR